MWRLSRSYVGLVTVADLVTELVGELAAPDDGEGHWTLPMSAPGGDDEASEERSDP